MTDVAVPLSERDPRQPAPTTSGVSFPEVVWAHYKWERDVHSDTPMHPEFEARFRAVIAAFEAEHGKILDAYWSTTNASAVAITVKPAPRPLRWLGKDARLRFHRATDWVTTEAPDVAEVMQRCDTLAIRAQEVLRDTTERIALQRIFAVASHLLGFLDRTGGKPKEVEARQAVESQMRELRQVREYYFRAGDNAGRLVYFWGMMVGVAILVGLALVILITTRYFDYQNFAALKTFFACYTAGALGALVSVMSRMSKGDSFMLDFEVGRPALRRLGSMRPFLGAVFGVVTYYVLQSGIIEPTTKAPDKLIYYYGSLAFVAGFSERWTKVLLGVVGQSAGGGGGGGGSSSRTQERRVTSG
jgi:hypothetical protein